MDTLNQFTLNQDSSVDFFEVNFFTNEYCSAATFGTSTSIVVGDYEWEACVGVGAWENDWVGGRLTVYLKIKGMANT